VTDVTRAEQRKSNSGDLKLRAPKEPPFFQLLTNYRSHGGIVNCANSVIELIKRFWPSSIDSLNQERGIVGGMKPVFITAWDDFRCQNFFSDETGFVSNSFNKYILSSVCIIGRPSNLARNNVGISNRLSPLPTYFYSIIGILVRDEATRDKLKKQIGSMGLVQCVSILSILHYEGIHVYL
jgi:hypothetical protein